MQDFTKPFTGTFDDLINFMATTERDFPPAMVRLIFEDERKNFKQRHKRGFSVLQHLVAMNPLMPESMILTALEKSWEKTQRPESTADLSRKGLLSLFKLLNLDEFDEVAAEVEEHRQAREHARTKTAMIHLYIPGEAKMVFKAGFEGVKAIVCTTPPESLRKQVNVYFDDGNHQVFVDVPYRLFGEPVEKKSFSERMKEQMDKQKSAAQS